MTVQKIRLLLLEDKAEDARRVRAYLREDELQSYIVRRAGSLQEGLAHLVKKLPDIILVDLGLPDRQGMETFSQLQKQCPQVPIVILTDTSDMRLAARAVQAGAQDFLNKDEVTGSLLRRSLRYALERNKADQAMRDSAIQWQTTFDATSDGICLLDLEHNILRTNKAMQNLFQKRQEQMLGKKLWEIVHGTKKPPRDCPTAQVTRDSLRASEIVYLDGKWLEMTVDPILDVHGELVGSIHHFRDITERKNTERSLLLMAETQRQISGLKSIQEIYALIGSSIQTLIGNGYVGVSHLDEPSQCMQLVGLFGFGELYDSLIKKFGSDPLRMSFPVSEMPPSDLVLFRSGRLELTEGGLYNLSMQKVPKRLCTLVEKELKLTHFYSMGFVWEGFHHGGLTILAKSDLAPYKDLIETTINQATLAIQRILSEQTLQSSEAQYRLLAEHIEDVIWIMDIKENRFVYVSPSVFQLRGYTPEEVMAAPVSDALTPQSARDMAEWLAAETQLIGKGEYDQRKQSYYVEQPCKDGTTIWTEVSTSYVVDGNGVPTQLIGVSRDITKSKQVEEQVHLQAVALSSAANAIVITDRKGTIQWINPAFEKLTGYSLQEAIGQNPRILRSGIQPDGFFKNLWETILSGKVWHSELVNKRKDGSLYSEEETITPLMDASGSITHFIGIKQDISSRKQAELELQNSHSLLTNTIESTADGILVVDMEGRISLANRKFAEMWGIPQSVLDTHDDATALAYVMDKLKEPQAFLAKVQELYATPEAESYDQIEFKDGRIFERVSQPQFQGNAIVGRVWVFRDITERRISEQALHNSEIQYRTLAEQLPAIVYIDDATAEPGHTLYVSPLLEKILGITTVEWMQGDLDIWLNHIRSEDRDRVIAEYMRCYQDGEPINSEYCMVAADGRLVWFLDKAALVRDENGKPRYIHGVMFDISERKQAEALQQAVYQIALAAETTRSLDDLYPTIHQIISSVMPSENFYITLYDQERDILRFPYFKDEQDEPFLGEIQPGHGLTAYVLRTGKSLLCTQQVHDELEKKGEIKLLGVPSSIWLGVPLILEGRVIGVMVVQHYSDVNAYGLREQHMLEFVSSQVAVAISRKQAEEALSRSESELRALFTAMPDLILVLDKLGRYQKIAPGNSSLLYQPAEKLLGRSLHEVFPLEQANLFLGQIRVSLEKKQTIRFEYDLQTDGRQMWFSATISPMTEESVVWIARDITESKHSEDLIRESEAKYRTLFDNVPDGVYRTTPDGKFLTINQAAVDMLGFASVDEILSINADQFYRNREDRKDFIELMGAQGEVHNLEVFFKNKEGRNMVLLENARAFRDENGKVLFYEGTLTDITERKQAEVERQTLLEIMQGLMTTDDLHDYLKVVHQAIARVIYAENFFVILQNKETGFFEDTYLVDKYDQPMPPTKLGKSLSAYVFRTGQPFLFDQATFDELVSQGEVEQVGASSPSWLGVPLITSREIIGVMVVQDYETEGRYSERDVDFLASIAGQVALAVKRKYAETELARMFEREKRRVVRLSELQSISADLNSLHTEREMLHTLVHRAATLSNSPVVTILLLDEAAGEMVLAEHIGMPGNIPQGLRIPITALPQEVLKFQKGEPVIVSNIDQDLPSLRKVLLHPDVQSFTAYPFSFDFHIAGVITLSSFHPRNPSTAEVNVYQLLARLASAALDNVHLFENINRSLKRMGALRRVDIAISSSFDLILTLNILLEQVTTHLEVDAADVLLFDPQDATLKYTCGRGFHGQALKFTNLKLGEGYAGRAALERCTIHIPNIQQDPSDLYKSTTLGSEEFVSYWGVPLLGKGQIQGVLEVFHRQPLHVDQEWLDFLETLAGQAAIAIDNIHLFDTLERSNADLSMAYDNTLAGWATALEMRDNDTEGHTRRVAALTMKLAGKLGMHDQEIMFLRWGSLLHDIGKMGIPDSILLKPGPLSEAEWEVMRRHPQLAADMLAPISYLREAMDIPHCHHEKWDGSGYPRHLANEQIPLSARIFAVVDVWDALTSDRPYRKAWTPEQSREYIRNQAGIHFDPKVAQVFLELIQSEPPL